MYVRLLVLRPESVDEEKVVAYLRLEARHLYPSGCHSDGRQAPLYCCPPADDGPLGLVIEEGLNCGLLCAPFSCQHMHGHAALVHLPALNMLVLRQLSRGGR